MGRAFTSDLYDTDGLAWAEQQTELLRRLAAGERVNELVDWPHVIEEVQDVGLSELRACRRLLRQAMMHLLKLHVWPDGPDVPHWRGEVATFLTDAQDCFAPSRDDYAAAASKGAEARPSHQSGRANWTLSVPRLFSGMLAPATARVGVPIASELT